MNYDDTIKRLASYTEFEKTKVRPWNQPNEHGEYPGDICCQLETGNRCYDHDRNTYIQKDILDAKRYRFIRDHLVFEGFRYWNIMSLSIENSFEHGIDQWRNRPGMEET